MMGKMTSAFTPKPVVRYWLYLGIVLVLAMVVIGGMTRLTHSGLSMVHWSFHGSLPPMDDVTWQEEFERYQESPEFKESHRHFTLGDFKSIYWWEYIHRMFGRLIGLVFIIPFVFFLIKKWIPKELLKHFFIILGLGAFQAFLGWFMVKSGLVDVPRVSHYRLAAHLSTAFIACSYIYWVALKYQHFNRMEPATNRSSRLPVVLGLLVLIQIIFGAFVAGLRAGWIHNTWPLMDGAIISPAALTMEPLIKNFIEGRSGVQFMHRTLGLIILAYAVYVFTQLKNHVAIVESSGRVAILLVLVQFILGVLTLLLEVPILMGVLHQVTALVLLLAIVRFYFSTKFSNFK